MKNTQDADPALLMNILRQNGWKGEEPEHEEIPLEPDQTLSIAQLLGEQEMGDDIPLDASQLVQESLPEKNRVRNLPGSIYGSHEEATVVHDPWMRNIQELGQVSVSEEELEEYTRALLHDQRFEINLPLLMGDEPLNIVVRSLYISEREVIACAVSEVAEKYPIKSLQNAALVADYFLKMAILVQVVSLNGKPMDAFDARPEEGTLPEKSEKVGQLAEMARLKFGQMHQAKLKMLIRALHTFETKQQILEDAYYNRDFRRPAAAH